MAKTVTLLKESALPQIITDLENAVEADRILAQQARVGAEQFASTPEDEPIQEDVYSALHYAAKAHESRDAAAVSAASANDKAILALSASTQAGLYKNAAEAAYVLLPNAERALADIIAHLLGRIETLEQELSESKYNVMQVNELSVVDNLKIKGADLFLFGTAAPAVAPDFVGQFFIDTTAGVTYQAKGITNAADWKATSNA